MFWNSNKKIIFLLIYFIPYNNLWSMENSYKNIQAIAGTINHIGKAFVIGYPVFLGATALISQERFLHRKNKFSTFEEYKKLDIELLNNKAPSMVELLDIIDEVSKKLRVPETRLSRMFIVDAEPPFLAMATNHALYVSKDFFDNDLKIKKFTIAHELIHFKERHATIRRIAAITIPLISQLTLNALQSLITLQNTEEQSNFSKCFTQTASIMLDSGITSFLLSRYLISKTACYLEKRADIQAITNMASDKNVITKWLKKASPDYSWYSYLMYGLKNLNFQMIFGFHDHPKLSKQIEYINSIKES